MHNGVVREDLTTFCTFSFVTPLSLMSSPTSPMASKLKYILQSKRIFSIELEMKAWRKEMEHWRNAKVIFIRENEEKEMRWKEEKEHLLNKIVTLGSNISELHKEMVETWSKSGLEERKFSHP